MKAISPKIIASLKTVASQEKKLRETITISEDLNITFGLLTLKEDQAVSAYVKALDLPKEEVEAATSLENLVWSIKAINGEEVDHSAFLELDPDTETGKPKSVVFHDYLREMIPTWNKELVDMIQSMLWIKSRLWTTEAEATLITSDGKKLVDLFQMMLKEQEARVASLPKEEQTKETKVEQEKTPIPENIAAVIDKVAETVPGKPKMTMEEYNAEQDRMKRKLGIETADQGALDDPYKTGEAKPVNIQDVIDERVKAQRNPIGVMAEGVKVPTAPPGYKVGSSEWDDTIPPMHGPSGVRKDMPQPPRVNVRNPNENAGSISSSVEFITEPVVDPISPIERHKQQRAKERGR